MTDFALTKALIALVVFGSALIGASYRFGATRGNGRWERPGVQVVLICATAAWAITDLFIVAMVYLSGLRAMDVPEAELRNAQATGLFFVVVFLVLGIFELVDRVTKHRRRG